MIVESVQEATVVGVEEQPGAPEDPGVPGPASGSALGTSATPGEGPRSAAAPAPAAAAVAAAVDGAGAVGGAGVVGGAGAMGGTGSGSGSRHALRVLQNVELAVTVELGRARLAVRELLELRAGSIVELDRAAGSLVDVMVNGTLLARARVLVVDDELGVRITGVVGGEPA
ncbi:FliM/FliN family flagellar motor switch protein [Aciditerrimonas ferrireducens]|uniref:FliM/FliN family flagellar motor switch protein n=1 Tax=Aciditerrimonas ferrireducens TaxID=667306 RepID=A0ABV6C4Y7_9ACTN